MKKNLLLLLLFSVFHSVQVCPAELALPVAVRQKRVAMFIGILGFKGPMNISLQGDRFILKRPEHTGAQRVASFGCCGLSDDDVREFLGISVEYFAAKDDQEKKQAVQEKIRTFTGVDSLTELTSAGFTIESLRLRNLLA